ncbi:putative ubiquitin-conjugating enzyme E2 24 isoform X2 [Canna indica]|uniref:E2 ubiquitin-conjugating enzyme n=1 Tax=Canna indica TaxID=4628 RepID=A0AAQ3KT01_9LILI|nr:putative ubiquitin-conjugating enzyme E2 24 isoform X2 [Canna indica]
MMDAVFVDSDSDFYTETSDSEDQDCSESLFGGHAQSILSGLDESIEKIDDYLSFERGFALGEIVCSVTDPSGQLGQVLDVDLIVDLETNSGELIKDVNSKNLLRVRSFTSGDFVVHGPWLGQVERVFDAVTILFNNGIKHERLITDSKVVTPISASTEDSPFLFYPGQRVKLNPPTICQSKLWLCASLKANQDEGIVCHADVGLVHVIWIASVFGQDIHSATPPAIQDPKDLTLLSCFSHVNWQLGDWCTLPVDYHNNLHMVAEKSGALSSPMCITKMQKEFDIKSQQMYVIAKTKSKVDVLWQNGERSAGLNPQFLSPVSNIGDHDFWPEQFVLEKLIDEDAHIPRPQRMGIVKKVDPHERTVKVKWIMPEFNQNVDIFYKSTEEAVSAYELIEHPDFSYSMGDVVFRQIPGPEKVEENIPTVQNNGQNERHNLHVADGLFHEEGDLDKSIIEYHSEDIRGYLSCIGNVIGYKDEGIEVKWGSGLISKVMPSEIFGLDKLLSPASLPSTSVEAFPANINKEVSDQEKQLWHVEQKQVANDTGGNCMKDGWKAASFLFPRAAFGFLTHVATTLFGFLGSTSLFDTKGASQYKNLKMEEVPFGPTDLQVGILKQQVELIKQTDEPTPSPDNDETGKFKQFDIVNDYSDHHFLVGGGNELIFSQVKKSWFKRVQQEWGILKNDLPDTIYVRVYEERMDLLRACLIGAPGTPYHDGLFFFDIFLPFDYPHEPPVVHYISGGLRLNPNLYESGKVCLSLLKTWVGTGSEVWHPENSTILQVLLSLQALVLNEKPYFNEAGYDEQIGRVEGEKNSITYNENAFLQSCKSMLYILRRPPKHFEELVLEHFTRTSHHILSACKAYLEGAQVGHAHENGDEEETNKCQINCSTGFKIMLTKLFPKLVSGFSERGIGCTQFLDYCNELPNAIKDAELVSSE